jgi:hypothetical protein
MYSQAADPFEQVNLAGRQEFRATATELRGELKKNDGGRRRTCSGD